MNTKIEEMVKLQNILNIKTCGEHWTEGITTNGRKITWLRYARQEISEAIDSSDTYKHWKNLDGDVDWNNLKIEIVDVWHFIISRVIEILGIDMGKEMFLYTLPTYVENNTKPIDYLKTVKCLEDLTEVTFTKSFSAGALILNFSKVMNSVHMDINELYTLYVIKNVLNMFRQDNGYKDGSYVKVIDGEEDNVHICRIFDENNNLTPDELYTEYEKYYITNKGNTDAS